MSSILIIDDEPYVREALRDVLQKRNSDVVAVADAEQGLQHLRDKQVDLVITDIVLPGMDGITAIQRIVERYPSMRIIAMSGGGSMGFESYQPDGIRTCAFLESARRAGAHGVLTKPFGLKELRAMIQQVLGNMSQVA